MIVGKNDKVFGAGHRTISRLIAIGENEFLSMFHSSLSLRLFFGVSRCIIDQLSEGICLIGWTSRSDYILAWTI